MSTFPNEPKFSVDLLFLVSLLTLFICSLSHHYAANKNKCHENSSKCFRWFFDRLFGNPFASKSINVLPAECLFYLKCIHELLIPLLVDFHFPHFHHFIVILFAVKTCAHASYYSIFLYKLAHSMEDCESASKCSYD